VVGAQETGKRGSSPAITTRENCIDIGGKKNTTGSHLLGG
jgi:hypothetical protein